MHLMQQPPSATTLIDGQEVDYFCGTGYFGLHGNPHLINAACDAVKQYGLGTGTSRAGYGNNPVLIDVEQKAAQFFEAERALYFVSGYLGNAILLQGLSEHYDIIFADAESHYSVFDGAAIAQKPLVTFAHLDSHDLARMLKTTLRAGQTPLVITDGIFPSSGIIAPLAEYKALLDPYPSALLCVDDAHASGVIGDKGLGSLEYCGVQGERCYSTGTLSKAFGGHGGIITGTRAFIKTLKRHSKISDASSSVPVPAAAASAKAIELLTAQPEIRAQLWSNVAYAKKAFRNLGFDNIPDTPVPIICLRSKHVNLEAIQQQLFDKGLVTHYQKGGSYSGVPKEGAIRVALFATHSKVQIDRLVYELNNLL